MKIRETLTLNLKVRVARESGKPGEPGDRPGTTGKRSQYSRQSCYFHTVRLLAYTGNSTVPCLRWTWVNAGKTGAKALRELLSEQAGMGKGPSRRVTRAVCAATAKAIQGLPNSVQQLRAKYGESAQVTKLDRDGPVASEPKHELIRYNCCNMAVSLTPASFGSLKERYMARHSKQSKKLFIDAVFCSLARYQCLRGANTRGSGSQAALHKEVMDVLVRYWDVQCECFASPLNVALPKFCSAFPDTDGVFGSLGSFFSQSFASGSFEANPPFIPTFVHQMAHHMHSLLRRTKDALSFIVIVPYWPNTKGWRVLRESPWQRHEERIAQQDHGFVEGAQHCASRGRTHRAGVCDISIFFLMTDCAFSRWGVPAAGLMELRQAFRSQAKYESRKGKRDCADEGLPNAP
eukprot:scaffold966_cov415-Prasinococcus_capsulatus_cf.AAC.18